MAAGSLYCYFWKKRNPANYDMYMFAVAAGMLAGEGLGGVFQALLAIIGVDGGSKSISDCLQIGSANLTLFCLQNLAQPLDALVSSFVGKCAAPARNHRLMNFMYCSFTDASSCINVQVYIVLISNKPPDSINVHSCGDYRYERYEQATTVGNLQRTTQIRSPRHQFRVDLSPMMGSTARIRNIGAYSDAYTSIMTQVPTKQKNLQDLTHRSQSKAEAEIPHLTLAHLDSDTRFLVENQGLLSPRKVYIGVIGIQSQRVVRGILILHNHFIQDSKFSMVGGLADLILIIPTRSADNLCLAEGGREVPMTPQVCCAEIEAWVCDQPEKYSMMLLRLNIQCRVSYHAQHSQTRTCWNTMVFLRFATHKTTYDHQTVPSFD